MNPAARSMTPADDALDFVFSFYERHRHRQQGRYDREVRRPDLIVDWARSRGLLPPRETTVLVTGSKGKGSASRLIAWGLASQGGPAVGLLLTPEERSHLDRIRIGNEPIPAGEFVAIVDRLRPDLETLQAGAPDTYYVPPTAIFLLVALHWWRQRGVETCVVEGGRGVAGDELGCLSARLGVVTAILPEHLDKLGPTLPDVRTKRG